MTPPIELGRDSTPQREKRVDTPETQGNRPKQNPEVLRYREKLESLKNLSSSTKAQLGEDFDAHISEIESDISKLENWSWSSSHLNREIRKNLDAIESKFDDFIEFTIENIWTEPVKVQTPEPVKVQPETQRWGWWDNDFGQNTPSNQPAREAPKESEAPIDTISPSSSSIWRLNLYKEYLVFKWKWNSALSRFINDIKQHAHLPKIEEVIGEVDAIMENYVENNFRLIGVSQKARLAFNRIIQESDAARNSIRSELNENFEDIEKNTDLSERIEWMKTAREEISKIQEMDFNTLLLQSSKKYSNTEVYNYTAPNRNVEEEFSRFINNTQDQELKSFLIENKEKILLELKIWKELFNKIQSELKQRTLFLERNRDHLSDQSIQIIEQEIKWMITYMIFLNGFHWPEPMDYFLWVLWFIKNFSIPGQVYNAASAQWYFLGIIAGTIAFAPLIARYTPEMVNKLRFTKTIPTTTASQSVWEGDSDKTLESQKKKLKSMNLEEVIGLLEKNKDSFPQQLINAQKLAKIIEIHTAMWTNKEILKQLKNLKNWAIWWSENVFSREVLTVWYGLKDWKVNWFKRIGWNIVWARFIESLRDVWGAGVIWNPVPSSLTENSRWLNTAVNFLFPHGHGIDNLGERGAVKILDKFIDKNFAITTQNKLIENWLRKRQGNIASLDQTRIDLALAEVRGEMMDESYSQAKTIVDNIQMWDPLAPISDLKEREVFIKRIELILDKNKWFPKTRISLELQNKNLFLGIVDIITWRWSRGNVEINWVSINNAMWEIENLLEEGKKNFSDINASLLSTNNRVVDDANVRQHMINKFNGYFTKESVNIKPNDIDNSLKEWPSEEETKAREVRKEKVGKNLKWLGKHFTWPTPDLSKLSPEDIKKLEKLTDTMLEVEKAPNYAKLPPELKKVIETNLAKAANDISGGDFKENPILKENLAEMPKIASIVDSFGNIFNDAEMKANVFPSLIDGLSRAELWTAISKLEWFVDLAKSDYIASDDEIVKMFKDAFKDPKNIDLAWLRRLRIYVGKMEKATPILGDKNVVIKTADEVQQEIRNQLLNPGATPVSAPNSTPNKAPAPTPTEAWVSPDSNETIRNSVTFDANGNLTGRAAEIYKIALLMDFFNNDWANTEVNKMNDFIERSKGFTDINEFKVELWEITWSIHPEWENLLNTLKNDKTIYQARDIIERTLISQWKKLPANWVQIEIRGWKIFIIKPATLTNGYDDINSLISWMRWKYTIVWDIPSWDDISSNREWFRNISIPDGINTWTRTKFQSLLELMRRAI